MKRLDYNAKKEWPRSYGITLPAKPRIQRSCRSSALHYPLLRLKAYLWYHFIINPSMYNLCGRTVQFGPVALFNSKRSGCSTLAEYSFHLSERSRCQCDSLFNHQHRTSKRHWCQRISDQHLSYRRKAIAAEIRIKHPPENVARFRETILRGLILFAGTRGYLGVTKSTRHSFCACDGFFVICVAFQWKVLNRREGEKQGY